MKKTQTAGGVVLNQNGDVLVVNQNHNSWSLPKGHVEEGESPLEAAKREIYEESGVSDVNLIKELGSYQRYRIGLDGGDDMSELKEIHMMLFSTEQMALAPVDDDNPEARWVAKEEVVSLLTHKKDKAFFENIVKQL